MQAVFTRTVADPEWGAKVTGKEGRNAVGVFVARDRQNNLLVPSNQGSRFAFLDDDVTSGVVRYRRDVGQRSTLGVLYTGREGGSYQNDVYGLDGLVRINTSNAIRFQYLGTETDYPDAAGLGGRELSCDGWHLQYDYLTRGWVANVLYTDLDPEFRADSGFVPRVDLRTAEARLQRRIWSDDGDDWYDQLVFGATGLRTEDHNGVLTDERLQLFADYQGPYQSLVELGGIVGEERFLDTLYSVDRLFGTFQIRPSGDLGFALSVERSTCRSSCWSTSSTSGPSCGGVAHPARPHLLRQGRLRVPVLTGGTGSGCPHSSSGDWSDSGC